MYKLILIMSVTGASASAMQGDSIEEYLAAKDRQELKSLKQSVYNLTKHNQSLQQELTGKQADIARISELVELMFMKETKTVATQTDEGPFILHRSPGSPNLLLDEDGE